MSWTPTAFIRLSLLGLVGGIVQLAAVSQITVFGVPADLSPLLVGAVGLLAGSIAGAVFGFSLGLFMDTTLLAAIGFSMLQFLMGVEAPVSLLLVRSILITVVLNTLLALPVYALTRRVLLPFLPDDPRRRRRRAYTTGGLSPLSKA